MLHETPRNLGNIALLIDADNSQHGVIEDVIAIISQYGEITHRYAYGNWNRLTHWQSAMDKNGITPKHRWDYVKGKDATDMELVIDAMDLLNNKAVTGFCIVSSDSDFTSLCRRIRESNSFVIGIGREQTPEAFVNSCKHFFYIEKLPKPQPTSTQPDSQNNSQFIDLFRKVFSQISPLNDWMPLSQVGHQLKQADPDFDIEAYGFSQLLSLIQSLPEQIEIDKKKRPKSTVHYVRMINK